MYSTRSFKTLIVVIAAALLPLSASAGHGHSATVKAGMLELSGAWARESIGAVKNGAAYLTIKNTGDSTDTLTAAASPAAEIVEIHEHLHDGDVMRMREVEAGVAIPAGEAVAFKPGGYHIMLIKLTAPLKKGESFPVTLTFEKAGETTVSVMVKSPKDKGKKGHHGHHDHN